MDTSETYIKMSDCPEIQMHTMRKEEWERYIYSPESIFVKLGEGSLDRPFHMVWLPRQDQLQGMLGDVASFMLVEGFYKFVFTAPLIGVTQWSSMEQLWLAFVMKEKFGKVWNGDKWIST